MNFFFSGNAYQEILTELAKQWLLVEINHRISKEGSNQFWRIANDTFHRLYVAKGDQGRKVPQFPRLREKMYQDDKIPPIHMEIGYQNKENGEIQVVEDARSKPVSRFPPSTYRPLYEIASVDVSKCFLIFFFNVAMIFIVIVRGSK